VVTFGGTFVKRQQGKNGGVRRRPTKHFCKGGWCREWGSGQSAGCSESVGGRTQVLCILNTGPADVREEEVGLKKCNWREPQRVSVVRGKKL